MHQAINSKRKQEGTLKVCRFMSVLTPLVDGDRKRQVFNTFASNNKTFYGSLVNKYESSDSSAYQSSVRRLSVLTRRESENHIVWNQGNRNK